ncbi:hypothetical protein I7I48_09150 [Histoplasma ohiense]|nr:hypothetical protein I7I48_09150 [Histoplasma ohiense (nom. inval.)]
MLLLFFIFFLNMQGELNAATLQCYYPPILEEYHPVMIIRTLTQGRVDIFLVTVTCFDDESIFAASLGQVSKPMTVVGTTGRKEQQKTVLLYTPKPLPIINEDPSSIT